MSYVAALRGGRHRQMHVTAVATAAPAATAATAPASDDVDLVDDEDYAALEAACQAAEECHKKRRRVPTSFLDPPIRTVVPPLAFPGTVSYLCTAYEVDAAVKQLLENPPSAFGWDVEWTVTYKAGQTPRPVALIQLCFAAPAAPVPAPAPAAYSCLLLHVARSGVTRHLQQLLRDTSVLKAGVAAYGDALKVERDFGLSVGGVLDLSEYAKARLCGDGAATFAAAADAPRKWSLASLCERILGCTVDKQQALRCSDWEAPLTGEQRRYAATDAWASLRLYEVLSAMPATCPAPPPPPEGLVPAEGAEAGPDAPSQPPGCQDAAVPACARPGPLQPAKMAVFELRVRRGWSFAQIAAHRRIQEDTARTYCAEGIAAGHAYVWRAMGVPGEVLESVAATAGSLLGRPLRCIAPQGVAGSGQPVDVLAALLAAAPGAGIRQLKEQHFAEVGYGQLRLALAHLGRCNLENRALP